MSLNVTLARYFWAHSNEICLFGKRGCWKGLNWLVDRNAGNLIIPDYHPEEMKPYPSHSQVIRLLESDQRQMKLRKVETVAVSNMHAIYLFLERILTHPMLNKAQEEVYDIGTLVKIAPIRYSRAIWVPRVIKFNKMRYQLLILDEMVVGENFMATLTQDGRYV